MTINSNCSKQGLYGWNLTINSGICQIESSFSLSARWIFQCQLIWRMSMVYLSRNLGLFDFFGSITVCSVINNSPGEACSSSFIDDPHLQGHWFPHLHLNHSSLLSGISLPSVSHKFLHPSLQPLQTSSMISHTHFRRLIWRPALQNCKKKREIETMCSHRVTATSAVVNGAAGKTNVWHCMLKRLFHNICKAAG